jgi:peptidyl-prolyl cis-trans isomerase C
MKRLLREPLLHFLLIGASLFVVYRYVRPAPAAPQSDREIRLSLDELSQLAMQFQSQWHRPPTIEEVGRLVEANIKQEILYREALAMGLDKDDTIVKRRMAQKMQFLAEDVATQSEPTTAELRSWFAQNGDKFAMPKRVSFRHLYFSPDQRGDNAQEDAAKALSKLAGEPEDSKLAGTLADSFMFQDYYRERATEYLGKEFGPEFAQAVAKLPTGSWQGPIKSGFGWHLVFVDRVIPGRVPDFEEIEPEVKTAWLGEQKTLAWEKAYKEMRAKYSVFLPSPPENAHATSAPSNTTTAAPAAAAASSGGNALRK